MTQATKDLEFEECESTSSSDWVRSFTAKEEPIITCTVSLAFVTDPAMLMTAIPTCEVLLPKQTNVIFQLWCQILWLFMFFLVNCDPSWQRCDTAERRAVSVRQRLASVVAANQARIHLVMTFLWESRCKSIRCRMQQDLCQSCEWCQIQITYSVVSNSNHLLCAVQICHSHWFKILKKDSADTVHFTRRILSCDLIFRNSNISKEWHHVHSKSALKKTDLADNGTCAMLTRHSKPSFLCPQEMELKNFPLLQLDGSKNQDRHVLTQVQDCRRVNLSHSTAEHIHRLTIWLHSCQMMTMIVLWKSTWWAKKKHVVMNKSNRKMIWKTNVNY